MFISNVGTSDAIDPILRRRTKNVAGVTVEVQKQVLVVTMVKVMFAVFSAIDIHDHMRQGVLAFHTHWKTNTWWHRLYSTILGIIVTDAYLMYKMEHLEHNHGVDNGLLGYTDFVDRLAFSLIHNTIDAAPAVAVARKNNQRRRVPTALFEEALHISDVKVRFCHVL